jgi:hypothetical protein
MGDNIAKATQVAPKLGDAYAILSFRSNATRAEIQDNDILRQYISENAQSWYSLARKCGIGEDQAPYGSLVLIKGCDKVASWEHTIIRNTTMLKDATFTVSICYNQAFLRSLPMI